MGDGFEGGSLWMKLVVIFTGLALTLDLFSAAAPGWSSSYGRVSQVSDSAKAVDALGVIGFLSVLIAFVLTLCLVLLDELKSAVKIVLIIVSIFSFIAGRRLFIFKGCIAGAAGQGRNFSFFQGGATF